MKFFKGIFILIIFCLITYVIYELSVGLLLKAPKSVFVVGLICSLIISLSVIFSNIKKGISHYYLEVIIVFLCSFIAISWGSALVLDFFTGWSGPTCHPENDCDWNNQFP